MSDDLEPTGLIAILLSACGALIGAIVYLWKQDKKSQRRVDAERKLLLEDRAGWDAERETLRANYEANLRGATELYAKQLADLNASHMQSIHAVHRDNRDNEAVIRREFAELLEQISAEAGKHSDAIRAVLQKFLDRFVGPRSRNG